MIRLPHVIRLLAALVLLALAQPAAAAASCTFALSGSTLVDFGVVPAASGNNDGQGTVSFTCIPDLLQTSTSYTVAIGTGTAGSFAPRRLYRGANSLQYNLYTNLPRTVIFGNGTAGTSVVGNSCTASCTVNVYGRIFGNQSGPAGPYSDSVQVTINF